MGHFIVGHDTDGLTQPLEVGLDWALASDKPFYLGQRSLQIQAKKPLAKNWSVSPCRIAHEIARRMLSVLREAGSQAASPALRTARR